MTKVAIMGYGTVGSGLIEIIDRNRENKKNDIVIEKILVKDKNECMGYKHFDKITENADEFFNSESEIVIELIGGINPAFNFVKRALESKKHVVTANKDLIAAHGEELFNIANKNNVALKFEAAVGGVIPIIKPLTETLAGNEITNIKAILNGTTNFILTKMDVEGLDYSEALKEAQDLGFAEANPESDVMGYDAARKLAILSTLAFNKRVDWKKLNVEGITEIDKVDFEYAKEYNCKIKLIGEAYKTDNDIYASLKPVLVSKDTIISKVDNEVNVVVLDGPECGEISIIGKGAGKLPTGSAVYGDLNDIINNRFTATTQFSAEEADLSYYSNKKCNSIVRIKTTAKEEIVEQFRNTFNNIKVLDKGMEEEVAIFVEGASEESIQIVIDKIKNKEYFISAKKLMFI